jgi:predicted glutamine amidotransferase
MMAFSFNQEVAAGHLVSALWTYAPKNPDGWGLAFYPDESAALIKEPVMATKSKLAAFLASYASLKARILVAHVRDASRRLPARQAHRNTHPFLREMGGKDYVFAHNGTLIDFKSTVKSPGFTPLGGTDSEALFCHLLNKMDREGIARWTPDTFRWLEKELQTANATGKLNCLLSDGAYLFAYHDQNGYNGMHYLACRAPYRRVGLPALSKQIDLAAMYLASAAGVIVATKPLTDEKWVTFARGQLMVWKDGVQVFPKPEAAPKDREKRTSGKRGVANSSP